ncbi:MAG: hypothetical protein N3C62_00620 [Synergistetes bacterium]|nr:hypothetical protein [Synergistota bacterium]MCX8127241.1 hypothetical protein [Synergistota bacterium]MDW8191873.1 hypothetical protein [Synergistota bacterium]
MFEVIRKLLLSGLGVLAFTREQIESLVRELVSKGELREEEGKRILEEFVKRMEMRKEEMYERIRQEIIKFMDIIDLARKSELEELKKRLKSFETRIELLEEIVKDLKRGEA